MSMREKGARGKVTAFLLILSMNEYAIYPKQFRGIHIPVEKNRCFFLMPFSKDFDYIYGSIKRDLQEAGYVCNRADEISGSKPILNKILTEILKSQYVIADLSDYNPNVFYELGVAHTFKDSHEILLLKQKEDKIPFDLTHLTYIEYVADNPKLLLATIMKFLKDNKPIIDFYEILNIKGLISFVDANRSDFVEYLHTSLNNNLSIMIDLLNSRTSELSEDNVCALLDRFQAIIRDTIASRNHERLSDIIRIYREVIVSAAAFSVTETFINNFIGDLFSPYDISASEVLSWQTDMMIHLAGNRANMPIALTWIISYFQRTKSGTIDLNRYKLESFLMNSNDADVNTAIAVSIHHEICYVREHMADIAGEKHLTLAISPLIKQLASEDNYFTAGSIITALGKIGDLGTISAITDWLTHNHNEILSTKQFFVLRRALLAITKLDDSDSKRHVQAFNATYGDIISDYFII